MANWTDSDIQLPSTAGNTGALVHHVQKNLTVGLVDEPIVVLAKKQIVTGVYQAAMAQTVVAALVQNGTSTGFLWITNPVANTTRACRIRKIWGESTLVSTLVAISGPRLGLYQMASFTGTGSGAALTAAKLDSAYASATLDIRTAVTGLTPVVGTRLSTAQIAGCITAVGVTQPSELNVIGPRLDEDEYVTLRPGEGTILYQDVAGTTAETRVFNLQILWDEIDIS